MLHKYVPFGDVPIKIKGPKRFVGLDLEGSEEIKGQNLNLYRTVNGQTVHVQCENPKAAITYQQALRSGQMPSAVEYV